MVEAPQESEEDQWQKYHVEIVQEVFQEEIPLWQVLWWQHWGIPWDETGTANHGRIGKQILGVIEVCQIYQRW